MAFGKAPPIPAHEVANPLLPRRDRTMEGAKPRNPGVPRAPRAKARANSCGAFARELKRDNNISSAHSSLNSTPTKTSESRRPAAESPFSHARVNMLAREKESIENQVFEMGPKVRASSLDRREDFQRGHALGREVEANRGMPWTEAKNSVEAPLARERRHVLRRERQDADQTLEWAHEPKTNTVDAASEIRSHARINVHARELTDAAQVIEMAPSVQVSNTSIAAVGPQYHGRRNILARETAEESTDNPMGRFGYEGDVPHYGRKQLLPPCAPRKAPQVAT